MSHENWSVGSHRTVDRLMNGHRVAICEVYSGAADSLKQVDEFQCLIAAAPDMLHALQAIIDVVDKSGLPQGNEWNGVVAVNLAIAALTKATRNIHVARNVE